MERWPGFQVPGPDLFGLLPPCLLVSLFCPDLVGFRLGVDLSTRPFVGGRQGRLEQVSTYFVVVEYIVTWTSKYTSRTIFFPRWSSMSIYSQCGCAGFWSTAQFGLLHWPSLLLGVAFLHEPGVDAAWFVQVLEETTAYKYDVYSLADSRK